MARKPTTTNADDIDARPQKYDSADFIIPARDSKGESMRVWVRIQPGHDRALSVILNSKKFPFKTTGDILRWCVHRGLAKLEKMEGLPSVTQQVEAMLGVLRDEEFQLEFQAVLALTNNVIQRHVAEGSLGEARRVIAKLKSDIDKMPEGYWRTKYQTAIRTQFGHLLNDEKARVGLMPERHHEDD